MNLDEGQRKKVGQWVAEGMKLSEIQNRIISEFGQTLTYMEVRLLVDDLKLTLKDPEPAKPSLLTTTTPPKPAGGPTARNEAPRPSNAPAAAPGGVSVSVDQLARPGALVSGKVTFSDGKQADWYMDQTGRLGLVPQQTGYRPPAADLQQFQAALESELAKIGF